MSEKPSHATVPLRTGKVLGTFMTRISQKNRLRHSRSPMWLLSWLSESQTASGNKLSSVGQSRQCRTKGNKRRIQSHRDEIVFSVGQTGGNAGQ
jgi:hypothetical protein